MQIATRFAEYGLTGAFFWICQLILLLFLRDVIGEVPWAAEMTSLISRVPPALETSLNNLFGALAIIAIFLTGLLLDLFGSYFIFWEMNVFKKHLERNQTWLKNLVQGSSEYAQSDFEQFYSRFGDMWGREQWASAFGVFLFWESERRRRYVTSLKEAGGRFKLLRPYNRLWAFLFSYVMIFSGSSQPTVLIDQLYLWRTCRAISTAMIIVFLELALIPYFYMVASPDNVTLALAIPLLLSLLIFVVSASITLLSYSRLCFTLFSLAYLTHVKTLPVNQSS